MNNEIAKQTTRINNEIDKLKELRDNVTSSYWLDISFKESISISPDIFGNPGEYLGEGETNFRIKKEKGLGEDDIEYGVFQELILEIIDKKINKLGVELLKYQAGDKKWWQFWRSN